MLPESHLHRQKLLGGCGQGLPASTAPLNLHPWPTGRAVWFFLGLEAAMRGVSGVRVSGILGVWGKERLSCRVLSHAVSSSKYTLEGWFFSKLS